MKSLTLLTFLPDIDVIRNRCMKLAITQMAELRYHRCHFLAGCIVVLVCVHVVSLVYLFNL